ncbi:hypothetical protein R1T08_06710 [Streptomyces sp. SBC-4]|nr:hypothetical protein [Streptomyces sp. SBC-4]MDV5143965.1 hypothetical protein [Streptomyces sp. SBC-4]
MPTPDGPLSPNLGDDMRNPLASPAAIGTVLLTAGMLLAAPAANARTSAYPDSAFDVTVGNTYTRGKVTWYNRSIGVSGEHKSVSATSCRGTTVFALDSANREVARYASHDNVCGTSGKFSFTMSVYVPGVSTVRVCLDNGATQPPVTYLECARYSRP